MTGWTLAKRADVAPFLAMDVLSAANELEAAGDRVIHMELGQPAAPTPLKVRQAAEAALATGKIGYTEALGIPALRQAIAADYRLRYGVEVPWQRVVVTAGSSGAFNLAFLALFNPGDRVALPLPAYPAYRNILSALGLEVVTIDCDASTRWAVTPAMLAEVHAKMPLKGLVIASPGNPSGTVIGRAALGDIAVACRELGIRLVSDEIYHGLVYDGAETTALDFGDDVVVINSFSKYYCMTGWRVGWMIVPPDMVRVVERLQQNLSVSVNALSQYAALGAFDATDELEQVKDIYRANRAILLDRLPKLGLGDFLPVDGAFYVYCNIRSVSNDSMGFAGRLLREAGVAATPGLDFDRDRGNAFLRFSFAGSTADISEAMDRLEGFMRRG